MEMNHHHNIRKGWIVRTTVTEGTVSEKFHGHLATARRHVLRAAALPFVTNTQIVPA